MNRSQPQTVDLSFLRNSHVQMRIAATTVVFAIAAYLYGTLATKMYRSTLTLVSAGQQKPGMASVLGAQLGGLASTLDLGAGAEAARIAAVLQSAAVTDAVIGKLDLKTRYDQRVQELARSALWGRCNVKILSKPNLVQLSCEDTDPKFAREMLAYFADYGNEVFRRVSSGAADEEVRFLERNVAEVRQKADDAAEKVRQFQETHQIVDLDSQARAVVSSVAAINSQRIAKQMELDYARTYAAGDEASARQLASQLSVMDEQLRYLEDPRERVGAPRITGRATRSEKSGMFPAALAVPRLRAEMETLYRDRKVSEATLVFALERLEGAKANRARDVSTFQVLDPPTLPDRHSSPQRGLLVLQSSVVGLIAGFAFEWFRRRKQ